MDQEQTAASTSTKSSGGGGKVIAIVIVLLIVILGGGYVAYAKLIKKASSLAEILSPASTLKLNPNCKYNDPDLCKFMNGWKDVKDMTMTSESTAKDGKKDKLTLKTTGSNKSQMVSEESGKENYNAITIDNTTYTKDYTDNKWFKYTSTPEKDLAKTEESKISFDTKADSTVDKTTYKKIGTEACGSLTCFKYQEIDPSITDTTQYIYFDNKEYMLRKTRSEGKDGSADESLFDYSSVSISAPSPTKEGNPLGDIPTSALPDLNSVTTPTDSSNSSNAIPDSTVPTDSLPVDTTIPDTTVGN